MLCITGIQNRTFVARFRGAMVARLTPDQEVACSNHVEIRGFVLHFVFNCII
ncbi:Uncharacterized protein APZ42_000708 [Daphnia magna]|uniref:Uncharacterized protein n=1 Tax=Daphnia magna TaxID=35525 RepID=A0A164JFW4_9CRUS|nr:Uncharacterized protein APZ42_000708 [Daphnia magna]